MDIPLLYEDKDIIVVNKPAGMVVHPGVKTENALTLVEILSQYTPLAGGDDPLRMGIVHRLDKDTSGIMIVTKTQQAYDSLVAQFKAKTIEKRYYAYVRGDVLEDEILIDLPIGRDRSSRLKKRVFPKGGYGTKTATTIVHVLQRYRTKTLVLLKPLTGRMHQLRVHMYHIGFPVIGDPLYGPRLKSAVGQQLQAFFLGFEHPTKLVRMTFEIPNYLK